MVQKTRVGRELIWLPSANDFNTGYDFTKCIVAGSYEVNNQPSYEEWTDADYRVHRVRTREQFISGSFQVKFFQREAELTDPDKIGLNDFLNLLGKEWYRCIPIKLCVYVNNTNSFEISQFYIEYSLKNEIPYMNGMKEDSIEGFTVNITEV